MRVNESFSDLIGKVISGVVVAHNEGGNPRSRIFLTFSDGRAFEFWAEQEDIAAAGSPNHGGVDQLIKMLKRRDGTQVRAFRAPHEDPDARQRVMLTDDDKQM